MKLLLISNSTNFGEGYLDHCIGAMRAVLGDLDRLAFVPFALDDRAAYGAAAVNRFAREGIEVEVATPDTAGLELIDRVGAVFVGGGNTFRLLKLLRESGLLDRIRSRVRNGMVYMGASAGCNMACPTIRTTNDMPIVEPGSFDALALVPMQINPHFVDADPSDEHMGETREQRLREFHEDNATPILGLREGAWLRVEDRRAVLEGANGARWFARGDEPIELEVGADLTDLLERARSGSAATAG